MSCRATAFSAPAAWRGNSDRSSGACTSRRGVLVRAGITADAGEAVLQHATRQKLVGDLRDDGAPRAVFALEAVVADRCRRCRWSETNRNSGDACGRRGWWTPRAAGRRVGHRRFESEERRAYARFGRGPSPFRCATGRFDATSARRRLNDACCCRADRPSAQREASGGPLATDAGVRCITVALRGHSFRYSCAYSFSQF